MRHFGKLKELETKRAELGRKQRKEYQTRGNTQRCQELWREIEQIDEQINEYIKSHVRGMQITR